MDKFPIYTYTKKELALMYFPDSMPHTAVNHLMEWIKRNKQLMAELVATGYEKSAKMFTPRQVALITEYLGSPGMYE